MFGLLKQQRFNNKKTSPEPAPKISRSPRKRQKSYSRIQKQKQNNSQLFDYEIAWICDHLYQGCFEKNRKHGQGIMIMSNGVALLGNWKKGRLNDYALFISPFGGKIHTNYKDGRLDGWVIVEYKNSFEILEFINDKDSLVRRRYDQQEQVWTESKYTASGKLQKIIAVQKTTDFKLPSYITNPSLINFYQEIIMRSEQKLKTTRLQIIKINDKFQYFGYANNQKIPNGLGVIYSSNELYVGNFKNGSLDEFGLILFENGLIYKGQIYGGKIWGNGVIYDINLDETKSVRVCQQGIEVVLEQEEGFNIEAVPFQIGKIPKMPEEKGFSNSIEPIFEQITKYYFRSNSTILEESSDESSIRASQESSDHSLSSYKLHDSDSRNQTSIIKRDKFSQTQNISPLPQVTPTKPQPHKKPSNSGSLSFSIQQSKQTPETNINPNTIPHPININLTPITNPSHRIPALTPTYEQISRQTQTQTKPYYPYLMQFQMSKNILSPYKFSKIGRIVANSLKIAENMK